MTELACAECGAPMSRVEGKKPPKFCGQTCRKRSWRKNASGSYILGRSEGTGGVVTITDEESSVSNRDTAQTPDNTRCEYNASSIKIVDDFSAPIWDWKRAEDWAHEYNVPVEWLKRAIRACREAGKDPHYIKARYLDHNQDIAMDVEVNDSMWLICKQLSHSVAQ